MQTIKDTIIDVVKDDYRKEMTISRHQYHSMSFYCFTLH